LSLPQFTTPANPPLEAIGVSVSPTDMDTLARTVWGEARGEHLLGQVAVAWVVTNRVIVARKDRAKFLWWGDRLQAVCLAPNQFSAWLPTDPNFEQLKATHLGVASFERAYGLAALVIGGSIADPTNGSTHYFADSIPAPSWTHAMDPRAKIGAHNFFREPSWS
jgi:spore germination cell wall hydrolase CwlJ-like protein